MPTGCYKRVKIPLLTRLQRHYLVDSTTNCWLWKGATRGDNYGIITINGNNESAHRVMFELIKGEITKGYELDHLCRTHNCINPDHLEAVTHRENVLRGNGLAAQQVNRTKCLYGHEYEQGKTQRWCRTCHKKSVKKYKQRLREQREAA